MTQDDLEKKLYGCFKNEIPDKLEPEQLDFLSRFAARNSKDYNPKEDKFLLDDAIEEIRIHTHIKLTNEEKTELESLLHSSKDINKTIKKYGKRIERSRRKKK